jgi:hypothetical protein
MGDHEKQDYPMNNATFNFLRLQAQIILPALGTLYFALAAIWGLPFADEVVGTIVALDAFLGILLGYSRKKYNESDAAYDGHLYITEGEEPETKALGLQVTTDPIRLDKRSVARLKIHSQ